MDGDDDTSQSNPNETFIGYVMARNSTFDRTCGIQNVSVCRRRRRRQFENRVQRTTRVPRRRFFPSTISRNRLPRQPAGDDDVRARSRETKRNEKIYTVGGSGDGGAPQRTSVRRASRSSENRRRLRRARKIPEDARTLRTLVPVARAMTLPLSSDSSP